MNGEVGFEINTLPCVKSIASGKPMRSAVSSAPCCVMT